MHSLRLTLRLTPRRGVTLVELVVALAVLTTAALLVPAVRAGPMRRDGAPASLPAVVATAQREAVHRGETVALTVDTSGEWRVVTSRGDTAAAGALPAAVAPARVIAVSVDMLGTCRPVATLEALVNAGSYAGVNAGSDGDALDVHRCMSARATR